MNNYFIFSSPAVKFEFTPGKNNVKISIEDKVATFEYDKIKEELQRLIRYIEREEKENAKTK